MLQYPKPAQTHVEPFHVAYPPAVGGHDLPAHGLADPICTAYTAARIAAMARAIFIFLINYKLQQNHCLIYPFKNRFFYQPLLTQSKPFFYN